MTAAAQAVVAVALAAILSTPAPQPDTFSNIPPTLSGGDGKAERIKHPKSAKALQCTTKCVGTCIRGGGGAPGEGPLNVRSILCSPCAGHSWCSRTGSGPGSTVCCSSA
ncbi:uncharacterized protein [Setaria viridis]|uniref:uncharacterized protein isoform X3 n=1 Tax=Setaria viridis TaxID=4556 RepID=UPI0006492196